MKLFSTEHIFHFPWSTVSAANWIKYPNPMTPHVTNVDYLSRYIDPVTGHLHTERLITCRQNAPEFFVKFFGGQNSSMVLEHSVVDPVHQKLVLKSTNVTLSHIMTVEETCTYESIDSQRTRFKQEAKITAWSGWSYLRETLEEFSINRFQTNASKGRAALEQVLLDLNEFPRQLLRQKFANEELVDQVLASQDVLNESYKMGEEGLLEPE